MTERDTMRQEADAVFTELLGHVLAAPRMTEELAEAAKHLQGEVPDGLFTAVREIIEGTGFTYECVADIYYNGKPNPNINGSTNLSADGTEEFNPYVRVRNDMSPESTLLVDLHETSHILLMHLRGQGGLDALSQMIVQAQSEVEAEVTAVITAYLLGHRHLEESAAYVAGYLHQMPLVPAMELMGEVRTITVSAAVVLYTRIMRRLDALKAASA